MNTLLGRTKSVFKSVLDMVMPPVCYVCGKSCSAQYGLCDDCLGGISHIVSPYCIKCGVRVRKNEKLCSECLKKDSYISRGWSCCYYKDTIKNCIHLFKYSGYTGLSDIFSAIMNNFASKNISNPIDIIVPVPIHPSKKRERSYNHSEILAKALSKNRSIPVNTNNLIKIKWTRSQSELDKKKREGNIKNTFFVIDKNMFKDKEILLVDDVYTTGSTINECAKTLIESGASKVCSLTLARSI
jgi:competence protein ComFC